LRLPDDLARAVAEAENFGFIAPSESGSVLDSAPSFASSGSAISNVDTDLQHLVSLVPGADRPGAAFVMNKTAATYLATLRGSGGAAAYPDLGPGGGTLLKLPVLVSKACEIDGSPAEGFIGLLNPSEIVWADEGKAILTTSVHTSLKMDDDPDNGGALVGLFATEATAIKGVRESAWYAKPGSGAYFTTAFS
jgi:HK97 family phage major capsid protein